MDEREAKAIEIRDYMEKVRAHLRQREARLAEIEQELSRLHILLASQSKNLAGKVGTAAILRSGEGYKSMLETQIESKRSEREAAKLELERARLRLTEAERESKQFELDQS